MKILPALFFSMIMMSFSNLSYAACSELGCVGKVGAIYQQIIGGSGRALFHFALEDETEMGALSCSPSGASPTFGGYFSMISGKISRSERVYDLIKEAKSNNWDILVRIDEAETSHCQVKYIVVQ